MDDKGPSGFDPDYDGTSPDVDDEAMIEKLRKMNADALKKEAEEEENGGRGK